MSFKTTLSLFAILIAMLFLFGMTLTLKHRDQDLGFALPSISKNASLGVDTVEIEKEGKTYVLFQKDKQWFLKLPEYREGVRADEGQITAIINAVRTARKSNEPDVTRNLADFGLDKPEITITLKKKGTSLDASLYLGKISQDKGYVYANSSERKREVLAVPRSTLKALFFQDINDLRSRQLLDVNDNTAKQLDLREHKDKKTLKLALQRGDGATWYFLEPRYGPANFEGDLSVIKPGLKDIKGVKDLLNAIGAIVVREFEPPGRVVISENNTLLRIEIENGGVVGQSKEILLIGPKIPHKEKAKEQYYARLASDEDVVRVDATPIDSILVAVEAERLRSHDLTHLAQAKPDRIEVKNGPGLKDVINLYKIEPNWEVRMSAAKSMKANADAIGEQGLLAALEGKKQIKHFLDDTKKTDEELGLDEKKPGPLGPLAVVKVFADSLEIPKAKDAKEKEKDKARLDVQFKDVKPLVTLTFAKKEGDQVTVKRVMADGGISRFVMLAGVLDKVNQDTLAYLDTTLPEFSPSNVVKLELKRELLDDKVDFIVKHEKSKDGKDWLLVQPKDLPNRPKADQGQVDEILVALDKLKAKKWVEKADPKRLPFGLDNPAITVTIQLEKQAGDKAEPKPLVYKFGQEAKEKDKDSYYALIPGTGELGDLVFLVEAGVYDILKKAELRDRTILELNLDKVKEIKLTVATQGGVVYEPVFKRPDKSWTISNIKFPDFEPKSVDAFLREFVEFKAKKYVYFQAKGKEAVYGLGDKAALKIDFVMDDNKTIHTLTIGKELPDKSGYYARYSGMPEVVFTVSTTQFSPLLGSLSFFSRNK